MSLFTSGDGRWKYAHDLDRQPAIAVKGKVMVEERCDKMMADSSGEDVNA